MNSSINLIYGFFDFEFPAVHNIGLWNFSPIWSNKRENINLLNKQLKLAFELSNDDSILILWMPAIFLHKTKLNPISIYGWTATASLISGGNDFYIAYIYRKRILRKNKFKKNSFKFILDYKNAGPNSSLTIKWILENLITQSFHGFIVDPYASRSAMFAQWCRRWNISYWGCIQDKENYNVAQKILAQIEFPAIQEKLPW